MDMTQLNDYTTRSEAVCRRNDTISPRLYEEYGVKKGLRDENGNGVLAGLTNISKITSSKIADGKKIPCDGQLWYRGYRVEDLIGSLGEAELGYEKIAYLLLMGQMPDSAAAEEFRRLLGECRTLPTNFTRDVIMKAPGKDIMNSMTRGILTLASYDERAIDTSVSNSLRQCIQLIAEFPLLAVYGYHAYNYYENMDSMVIHRPDPALSTAENLLMMLRPNKKYTATEAKVLDTALILHMEHGGGNNSTFTTRVITSSGSDTYSTIAAAMSSLKGPKHGGANIKVMEMMEDIRLHVPDCSDKEALEDYLAKIINKEAFRPEGACIRHGSRRLFPVRPQRADFQGLCGKARRRKGARGRPDAVPQRGGACPSADREAPADLQGRQPQRGLLQRLCLRHAGNPPGAVHGHVRRGEDRGMERPPDRGADLHG